MLKFKVIVMWYNVWLIILLQCVVPKDSWYTNPKSRYDAQRKKRSLESHQRAIPKNGCSTLWKYFGILRYTNILKNTQVYSICWWKSFYKSNDSERRSRWQRGRERPGAKNHRFLFKILLESNGVERQGRWEPVVGSGPDPKSWFLLKFL